LGPVKGGRGDATKNRGTKLGGIKLPEDLAAAGKKKRGSPGGAYSNPQGGTRGRRVLMARPRIEGGSEKSRIGLVVVI